MLVQSTHHDMRSCFKGSVPNG